MFRREWFAKFFPKEVVRSLGKLRGKPRRRFRDRLLTVVWRRVSEPFVRDSRGERAMANCSAATPVRNALGRADVR